MKNRSEFLLAEIRRVYSLRGAPCDKMIVEGRTLVGACLAAGLEIEGLVLVGRSHRDLLGMVSSSVVIVEVDSGGAHSLAGFPFHRGVLGLVRRPSFVEFDSVVERVGCGGLLVFCPHVADPGNLGAIARCAAAFRASGLIVGAGGADVFGRKALRGSSGSVFTLPVAVAEDPISAVAKMRHAGLEVVAADGGWGEAIPLERYSPSPGTGVALVLGNEGHGLPDELLSACDRVVRISICPTVESLNAACAAAVLLYAILGRGQRVPEPYSA